MCKHPAFLVQRVGPFSCIFQAILGNLFGRGDVRAISGYFEAFSGNFKQFLLESASLPASSLTLTSLTMTFMAQASSVP